MATGLNEKIFKEAVCYLPGGVNSPVRSFKSVGGTPVFMKSGRGSKIYSLDNREFIDYCLGWGALILGHSHPAITKELKNQAEKGTSLGTATKQETEFAKLIAGAVPSIEQVRLTNSGTEAVMVAVRLARAFSGKRKIIRFAGSYHGHADYFLDCPGVPGEFKKHTLTCHYNNIENTAEMIEKNKGDMAGIIVEPVAGNTGVILPEKRFLPELKNLCLKYGIILIFDEVITGFRFRFGGFQDITGIKPDITCLGKIIGGGLPVGACGGKKEIMRMLSPSGDVFHAGTFAGNSMSVSAGMAALKTLEKTLPYKKMTELTKELCEGIKSLAKESGIKLKINYIGPLFSIFLTGEDVKDWTSAKKQDTEDFKRFYHGLLKEGIYFSPSCFEANFVSSAHTKNDINKTLQAIKKVFKNS
ncbi:MAG: glutamate-1-semialdehyde 2,1-aminomutase [Candidatus Omnitrophica bacterium]|nr:glutamate-1-semialdehyde 2,1-aminomutase [Candidatus Omnitrophota bacterium]